MPNSAKQLHGEDIEQTCDSNRLAHADSSIIHEFSLFQKQVYASNHTLSSFAGAPEQIKSKREIIDIGKVKIKNTLEV